MFSSDGKWSGILTDPGYILTSISYMSLTMKDIFLLLHV